MGMFPRRGISRMQFKSHLGKHSITEILDFMLTASYFRVVYWVAYRVCIVDFCRELGRIVIAVLSDVRCELCCVVIRDVCRESGRVAPLAIRDVCRKWVCNTFMRSFAFWISRADFSGSP